MNNTIFLMNYSIIMKLYLQVTYSMLKYQKLTKLTNFAQLRQLRTSQTKIKTISMPTKPLKLLTCVHVKIDVIQSHHFYDFQKYEHVFDRSHVRCDLKKVFLILGIKY